jgi:hypothetical protein
MIASRFASPGAGLAENTLRRCCQLCQKLLSGKRLRTHPGKLVVHGPLLSQQKYDQQVIATQEVSLGMFPLHPLKLRVRQGQHLVPVSEIHGPCGANLDAAWKHSRLNPVNTHIALDNSSCILIQPGNVVRT